MIADVLRNVNGFVDGRGYAGKFDSVTLPKLTVATEDYRGGGMDAAVRIDMGLEPMESMIESAAVDANLLRQFGIGEGAAVPFVFRGALQSASGAVAAAVATMRGWCSEVDWGDWKPGEKAPLKLTFQVRYYKFEHGGATIHEIDSDNMVRIIDGVDRLEGMRTALGL